ncbi:MAG: hypothetical protein HUU46_06665 [Candidatus Hydrogenedentes bacterium]|nr:hypothetical protein [Candidatus Hydrogenedentota bacterium]
MHRIGALPFTAWVALVALAVTGCPRPRTIEGEWVNDDPDSISVTRLIVDQVAEDQTTLHAYAACKGNECDWGTQFAVSDANPNTWWVMYTIYHLDDVTVTLQIDLDRDTLWVLADYRYTSTEDQDFFTLESFHRED